MEKKVSVTERDGIYHYYMRYKVDGKTNQTPIVSMRIPITEDKAENMLSALI